MAGGGQNKKKEITSGRPKGVTPSMGITLMQNIAPPPPPPLHFILALFTLQNTAQHQKHTTLNVAFAREYPKGHWSYYVATLHAFNAAVIPCKVVVHLLVPAVNPLLCVMCAAVTIFNVQAKSQ